MEATKAMISSWQRSSPASLSQPRLQGTITLRCERSTRLSSPNRLTVTIRTFRCYVSRPRHRFDTCRPISSRHTVVDTCKRYKWVLWSAHQSNRHPIPWPSACVRPSLSAVVAIMRRMQLTCPEISASQRLRHLILGQLLCKNRSLSSAV